MLALALLVLLAAATTAPYTTAAMAADEDRSLATLSLNTLTTSCNGGCKTNSACVVLGQSSENPINCVSDARCATLLSGKAALCMEPFVASAGTWTFAPAKTSTVAGVAPFERVGLVQVGEQVRTVYVLLLVSLCRSPAAPAFPTSPSWSYWTALSSYERLCVSLCVMPTQGVQDRVVFARAAPDTRRVVAQRPVVQYA